ncbi:MAG TPA: protein kinase [Acidobacteriota bacterium]|nr:protein kinase [Acidobacteriota bacterium]
MKFTNGTQLLRYLIIAPLGKGGMGEVYRAKDTQLDREVALKVLPDHLADHPDALRRFQREAKSLAALSHPTILTIFDVGTDHGCTFVVTELLVGETLRIRIARSAIPWQEALKIAAQLAEGLSAAHSKGVIHRDLKPENIFLTSENQVKILDFGLARRQDLSPSSNATELPTSSLPETHSGVVMGTVPYMSPEQVRGETLDARSDLFSFGCVLHEMITGSRTFSRNTSAETLAAILKEEPLKLTQSGKQVPLELERVIERCLEKKPEQRVQSARDLAIDLSRILDDPRPSSPAIQTTSAGALRRFHPAAWIGLVVLLVSGIFIYFLTRSDEAIGSVAVLPFANVSGDTSIEYLTDGITESIISRISKLPSLKVTSRNSAFHYKGKEIDPREVRKDLNVQAVVLGRILRQGENLSIGVELIDTRDNSQLWGEQYNRKVADVFDMEEGISKEIAQNLRLKLTGQEEKSLAKNNTESTQAYELYLKGRYFWNSGTPGGFKKGIEQFQQAIQQDPGYAAAYAGLAYCYIDLATLSYMSSNETLPQAKAAAQKALQLDNSLAEAHAVLGFSIWMWDHDKIGAEKELKRAIEIDPQSSIAHYYYGYFLWTMGRYDEMLAESTRARDLDPLSAYISANLAYQYLVAGRFQDATRETRKAIALDPNLLWAQAQMGWIYTAQRKHTEAIAVCRKLPGEALVATSENQFLALTTAWTYAAAGQKVEAEKILDSFVRLSEHEFVDPYWIAAVYDALGDQSQALDWLEKGYQQRSAPLVCLNEEILWRGPIRLTPRFQDLVRRLGLTPDSR